MAAATTAVGRERRARDDTQEQEDAALRDAYYDAEELDRELDRSCTG